MTERSGSADVLATVDTFQGDLTAIVDRLRKLKVYAGLQRIVLGNQIVKL